MNSNFTTHGVYLSSEYTIHHFPFGIVICGYMPLVDFFDLQKLFQMRYGFDQMDERIANHYNATLCLTTKHKSEKWRMYIQMMNGEENKLNPPPAYLTERVTYRRKRSRTI